MKKIRILSLGLAVLLLLLPLAACQPKSSDAVKDPASTEVPEPVEGPKLADLKATDSLVVYIMEDFETIERRQIDQFTKLYDVDVEVVCVAADEYRERVMNDLASGSGPDVLFLYQLYALDIVKAALNHNFLDLTDLLAEDPDFSEDDYLAGVFEACQVEGRQYTVSFSYMLPVVISSKEKLEELGFDWNNIDTIADFLEEIARLTPKAEKNDGFAQMLYSKNNFYQLLTASGVSLIDYENGKVLPDEKGLRKFLEAYKAYFPHDYDETGMSYGTNTADRALIAGSCVFWPPSDIEGVITTIDAMEEKSCNYVIQSIPGQTEEIVGDIRGGLMAINANTKNSLNAYNFVKFMLSEEAQKDTATHLGSFPIHKEAIRKNVYEAPSVKITGDYTVLDYEEPALSDEGAEMLIEMLTGVDRFVLGIPNIRDILFESMLPFFQDEKSYDDCLSDLKNRLTLYLSE